MMILADRITCCSLVLEREEAVGILLVMEDLTTLLRMAEWKFTVIHCEALSLRRDVRQTGIRQTWGDN